MDFRLPALASIVVLAAGCYVRVDDDHDHYIDGPPASPTIYEATIDPGEQLETTPGDGAGAFIEYESGGRWHVFTACDTNLSDLTCTWDVLVSADTEITNFDDEDLEAGDDVFRQGDYAVLLQAYTDVELDGFFFETEPGETVRVEAWLDGRRDARFIFWVGDGGLHRGAPSNPIDLTPASP